MSGPPPWTITGFRPTYLSSTTSVANAVAQLLVAHRRAAVLDHHRAAVELADVGQRLEQRLDARRLARSGSRRVLRVEPHVVVGQVAEVDVGRGVAAAEARPRSRPRRSSPPSSSASIASGPSSSSSSPASAMPGRLGDPAPVGVAAVERGLDQRRVGDRPRDPLGLLAPTRASATSTRPTRVAPSPSATISSASWSRTASSRPVGQRRARRRRSPAAARCRWCSSGRRR